MHFRGRGAGQALLHCASEEEWELLCVSREFKTPSETHTDRLLFQKTVSGLTHLHEFVEIVFKLYYGK